uniref:HMA domain-containing protein n=1 Tax=Kwoniella dejecticola CBS 10117 TaxID=1296121 RepID=A0A1A6A2V0_9TREE|nr:uncharacterized protein I303_05242 [Kwoniella dejecticola CBS 10117]OBR84384.1 hypothetical protein I303_05242 [Kwoniella dejecticola CBS 10117]
MSTLPISLPTITLLISNMHCTSCCETIDQLLSAIPSIKSISTNLLLHTVTFSVDPSSSASSSGRPKTVGRVLEEVLKVLRVEGGFIITDQSANGHSLASSSSSSAFSPIRRTRDEMLEEDEYGLIGRLFFSEARKIRKQKKSLEERRKKHLEHCKTCQDELAGKAEGRANSQESETSERQTSSELKNKAAGVHTVPKQEEGIVKTTLSIGGMTCASCVNSITSSLKSDPAILEVNINLLGSSGVITHKSALSHENLVESIEDIGFEATIVKSEIQTPIAEEQEPTFKSTFSIEGMTCSSCSQAITRALQDHKGIVSINIDVLNNSGTVVHTPEITIEEIKEIVEEIGYDAELSSSIPLEPSTGMKGKSKESGPLPRTVRLKIDGMFCHDCVRKINSYLDTLPVETYTPITLHQPVTIISYIPHEPLTIRDLVDGIGGVAPEFEVEVVKTQSLNEKSQKIQKREVKILASHCAVAIIFAIPTFIIAIVSMILLPSSNAFKMHMMKPVWGAANLGTVILWPLATVVQFGVGSAFKSETMRRLPARPLSWKTLISFGSMDLLVVLSTSVSYFASLAMLILDVRSSPHSESVGTYFDSCVFLIMFILLGRTLEAFAKSRTTDAISLLGKMRPDTALLVETSAESGSDDTHGTIERKDKIGDLILLPPGSLPPTDGIIASGHTTFDESSLTGESRPITKDIDDQVFTGTVNLTSAITMRVTGLEEDTMIEKIIRAVSDASSKKANLELIAEKLTGYFVPIIVYFSLLVLLIWLSLALTGSVGSETEASKGGGRVFFALEFAIATLVVACPCGIGLAIPCANSVGNGLMAKKGILSSGGGQAFLAATKISKVVFDKTGTLTLGKCVVIDEHWTTQSDNADRNMMVRTAVREVEKGSTHPLAVGLVEYLDKQLKHENEKKNEKNDASPAPLVEVTETQEIAGRGLKATVEVNQQIVNLLIGNVAHLSDHEVALDVDQQAKVDEWSSQGKSVILIASSFATPSLEAAPEEQAKQAQVQTYTLSAIYSLSDPPREESIPLIKSLKERGIQVSMLSGDNTSTAQAVGQMIGLDPQEIRGGVGPEGKADVIREMQLELKHKDGEAQKGLVMFVGDGLNDSVALAAADVSCAMGHGSQATLASADFVLLSSTLTSIPTLIGISRKIIRRQKINLLWALLFNVVCLPFAAGVFYAANHIRLTPVWSAVLMALSSLSVVGSSLAMRWGL